MADTFERSCEHWSEARRGEMEDFYALATVDYRHLAEHRDWKAWLEARQESAGERALRLLDVACGSGKFPAALLRHGAVADARVKPIRYDLLDPSAFSIAEARRVLELPFVPAGEHETTLQAFSGTGYDVVWATHALYALPAAELEEGLRRFVGAIGDEGEAFIAHASQDAHYLRFYRLFLAAFREDAGTPYTSAEQIEATLRSLGARVERTIIDYHNGAPDSQRDRVEGFLQRCAFDDSISLDEMRSASELGRYLDECLTDGQWRFRQRVFLLTVTR